jgi:RNA polymerase sigma factor (sigma-70 family)
MRAWNDPHNIRVMKKAARSFANVLTHQQQTESIQLALLRCLKSHQESRQKFTTSLYRFAKWELQNTLRSAIRQNRLRTVPLRDIVPKTDTAVADVMDCIESLDEKDQRLIRLHYLESMTFEEIGREEGYSREAAYYNVHRAVDKLRLLCLSD